MTINERFEELIKKLYNGNKRAFATTLGISPTVIENVVGKRRGKPSYDVIEKVCANANISPDWLLTGQGPMLKDKEQAEIAHAIPTEETKGIPLIPVGAMAGYANGDVQAMDYEITHHYNIPDFENRGVKFMIRASGSSMYPKYSNGDILACRPITDLSFFQWGKVYVLDTDQGPLVKRLFPCPDNDEYLECHSDNKANYPPFPIRKSSIRKVAIVVGVIRLE